MVWPGYGHGPFFERMDDSRFVNCCWDLHKKEIQLYFRNGLVNLFPDDHLFISEDLQEKFLTCEVVNNENTRLCSDHIPLMIELDFSEQIA